jgi:hypothetical protein
LIPFATGGGAAIRAAAHADDLARAGRMLDNTLSGGRSVLGHHPEYLKVASDLGAKRFDVPESIWKAMSEPERWAANRKFLDRAIARSDDIVLATPLEQMRPGSYFAREVDYLLEKGYKLSKDGTRLLPGK